MRRVPKKFSELLNRIPIRFLQIDLQKDSMPIANRVVERIGNDIDLHKRVETASVTASNDVTFEALLAILAVMPLSWLAVARGGAEMHPLVLGLSPLMMVGVVLMSTREIPVLEIPPLPGPLPADRWRVAGGAGGGSGSGSKGGPGDGPRSGGSAA